MTGRLLKVSAVFILLIMLVACSTTESLGPQGMEGAMMAEPLGDYHLRPGDEIQIRFFYNPDLNETLMVGPDGKICLPLLDEILVAGLTSSQVDDVLTKAYLKHLANVSINVTVREYSGLKVYVGGEVARPGFYSLKGNMSVLEAILAANGFKETAKPESVVLVRKGPGNRPVAMAVDLRPVLSGEQLENDIYVMPSDIVYVPKTFVAKAGKFVDQYLRRVLFLDAIMQGAGWALGDEWVRSN
ncbi:MAG: polysaccharide biosynthesis/export family protein [Thermodesulfobacteriota bacterium]|nr:polysaccharide biosynthesis/export family protein [Thermodesulfobacteriota bacterium]